MASPTVGNRGAETSTTTGTGTYSLDGAISGFQTIVSACGDGNTVHYYAKDQATSDWEVGEGVITDATPDTLTRGTIFDSSNAGAAVNWSAGTRNIVVTFTKDAFDRLLNDDDIGSTVQAHDDDLDDISALAHAKGNLMASDGTDWDALGVGSDDEILIADSTESLGVKWGSSSTGAVERIETWTPTAVNSKDFTWDESKYSRIIIVGEGIVPATDNTILYFRLGYANGGTFLTSLYTNNVWDNTAVGNNATTTAGVISVDTAGAADGVGNDSNEGAGFCLNIINQSGIGGAVAWGEVTHVNSVGNAWASNIRVRTTALPLGNTIDSFRLFWAGVVDFSATGKVYLYGVKRV